ncbi:MAG: serine protein kinase PrkA [Candidatus Woesearchaeota archaeon]
MLSKGLSLDEHIEKVAKDERRFENVYRSVSRMMLEGKDRVKTISVNGMPMQDYSFFREGKEPIVGMYDEINRLVNFFVDGANSPQSRKQGFVFIGRPGNAKTHLIKKLGNEYLNFLSHPGNERYTIRFNRLDELDGEYGDIAFRESETFEDPMILAMNLFPDLDDSIAYMKKKEIGEEKIEDFMQDYRSLNPASERMLLDILERNDGDPEKALSEGFIDVVKVPLARNTGNIFTEYKATDEKGADMRKLTGKKDMILEMKVRDKSNPVVNSLRSGSLARSAGGGIHFSDEQFKNPPDFQHVYLGVIQDGEIPFEGLSYPADMVVLATSNNEEFNRYAVEGNQKPIVYRFVPVFVGHITNYKDQQKLTEKAIGENLQRTVYGNELHVDPNLNYALSVSAVLTRLPEHEKLDRISMMKLAAGEAAGEKTPKSLAEIVEELNSNMDVDEHFGHKGLGYRDIERAVKRLKEKPETIQSASIFARDTFDALRDEKNQSVIDPGERAKIDDDLTIAKELYKQKIKEDIYNAYMDDTDATRRDVQNYVNMVIWHQTKMADHNEPFSYRDPMSGDVRQMKMDKNYMNAIEEQLGLTTDQERESYRSSLQRQYGHRMLTEGKDYDFMQDNELVKAVVEVRINSDVAGHAGLKGALANRTHSKDSEKLYNRMMDTMTNRLGYNNVTAEKTLDYFCEPDDES